MISDILLGLFIGAILIVIVWGALWLREDPNEKENPELVRRDKSIKKMKEWN